jgi:hypothetical protein
MAAFAIEATVEFARTMNLCGLGNPRALQTPAF